MQDKDLVKACQRNNRKAQKELYERHKSMLMGVCLRYAPGRTEAEDIYQEAFIKIFNNIEQLKKPEALAGWMRRTVVHTAIDHFHKEKKHTWTEDSAEVDVENDDYTALLQSIDLQTLLEMINELPDGYRVIFNMYVVDGYSHPEISEMLKISENTSRTQLFKAKARLKKKLAVLGINKFEKYG